MENTPNELTPSDEPQIHHPILGGRLGKFVPSGVVDIDLSTLVEGEPVYCPKGFSKRAAYLMSLLHLGIVFPNQFRTECGTKYSCEECPLGKSLQE